MPLIASMLSFHAWQNRGVRHFAPCRSLYATHRLKGFVAQAGFGGFGTKRKLKKPDEKHTLLPKWENEGTCPCGSGRTFGKCCEPYILGRRVPENPETLMRSRFSAYALKKTDWIVDTTHPDNPAYDGTIVRGVQKSSLRADTVATMKKTKFYQLQILEAYPGRVEDEGFVKFRAWFKFIGQKMGGQRDIDAPVQSMTEKSRFCRVNGKWLYREAVESDYTAHTYPAQP